jgi:hypothetical protein
MDDLKKYQSQVDSHKHLRSSIRKVIERAQEKPDEWLTLELSNKKSTRQLTIEIKAVNGKPRFRLLGSETSNQPNVYEIAKRELDIEEWSKS